MWDEDYAVVFSGGGALGAWEVGCLKAVVEKYNGRMPAITTGASAGAINAVGVCAGMTVDELERSWSNLIRSDVCRWDLDLWTIAKHLSCSFLPWNGGVSKENLIKRLRSHLKNKKSLFDKSSLQETLFQILRSREHHFLSSKIMCAISATNLTEGKPEIFYKLPPGVALPKDADQGRYKGAWTKISSLQLLLQGLKGTAALPILFPPMENRFDGGVLLNQPLLPAIRLGAKNIFVFIPSPEAFGVTDDLFDIAQTLLTTWLATSLTAQIRTVAVYNIIHEINESPKIRLCVVRPGVYLDRDPGVGLLEPDPK